MSYIGRGLDKISNIEKLDAITFDGSQSYSLTKSSVAFTPNSANSLIISINGVCQFGNVTVSGTSVDFGVAMPSTDTNDFILHLGVGVVNTPADDTVATAKIQDDAVTTAKIVDDAVTSAKTDFFNADTSAADIGTGLHVKTGDSGHGAETHADELVIENDANGGLTLAMGNSNSATIAFANTNSNEDGKIVYRNSERELRFNTAGSERLRIDSSGNVLVGKTTTDAGVAGCNIEGVGTGVFTRASVFLLLLNRLTDDGSLISLRQANTEEGTISVSGSTVSYNAFTGSHWSRFSDNSKPTILRGTVLETLDTMVNWYNLEFNNNDGEAQKIPHVLTDSQSNGDIITYNHEGTDVQATIVKEADIKHMMSKVSDTTDAKNVYGVFNSWDNYGEGYNDFIVASVGSFVVRIKADETIAKGDLLQSNGDGTAKVQSDDNVKSSSFAKILSTTKIETYDDGSFIVPCSLMS